MEYQSSSIFQDVCGELSMRGWLTIGGCIAAIIVFILIIWAIGNLY